MTDTPAAPPAIAPWIARGAIDAELAGLTWLLVEAGVPLLVAGTPGTGRAALRDAVATFLPADSTRTVLRGDDEDFDWLPEAVELGWHRDRPARPAGPRSSSGLTVMVADLDDRPGGTWGERARIAIRALSLGYGMLATVPGDRLEEVFDRLGRPPVEASEDELSRLGLVLVLARRRRPGHGGPLPPAGRPRRPWPRPAARAGGPRDLGRGEAPVRALRLGHRRRARGSRRADAARLRTRAGPAGRDAGDGGVRAPRLTPRARGATLAARAETADPGACRGSLDHRSRLAAPRTPRHPRGAARLRLAAADGQGGAARQPDRAAAAGTPIFPGIIGYDDTVIPAIENAILAGQDIVFLGERGQAKTRLARLLVGLLDEWLPGRPRRRAQRRPVRARSAPRARAIVAEGGDATPIDWLPRDRRYAEKLATPDITIADLIGEVDPIKVAEGRYLSDELTIHYGLIPRTNRGIFAMNELPDLAERIQVGLLNILEERDVQVRGFTLRLPLDLFVVASANPEDYTSRGRIITPLKDRLGSQIRTHYPRTLEHEIAIMRQEKQRFPATGRDPAGRGPGFMEELVAELTHLARRAPEISQRCGVSACASASPTWRSSRRPPSSAPSGWASRRRRRAISDLGALLAVDDRQDRARDDGRGDARGAHRRPADDQGAVATFNRRASLDELDEVVSAFEAGLVIETGERVPVARVRPLGARDARAGRGGRRLGTFA